MAESESTYVRTLAPPADPDRAGTGPDRPTAGTCRRIAGRRGFSGQSLYATDDFLLCVNGGVFQETYRRFYYRDIQAILLRKTGKRSIMIVLSIIAMVAAAVLSMDAFMYARAYTLSPAVILWLTVALLSAASLVWNIASRGQCVCYIQTPVSIQRLPVTCVRAAQRLMAELSTRIEAAQAHPSSVPDPQPSGTPI